MTFRFLGPFRPSHHVISPESVGPSIPNSKIIIETLMFMVHTHDVGVANSYGAQQVSEIQHIEPPTQ